MTDLILSPLSLRIGDLELRTCDENLLQRRALTTAEVIRWEKRDAAPEFCYVLAMWRKGKEGYSLEFIGGRPFDAPEKTFWRLAKFGQESLDEAWANREGA